MVNLQPYFNDFDKRIQLSSQRFQLLDHKRQLFQQELTDWFQNNLQITPAFQVQGSMYIQTGVEPLGDGDFDIDIAVILDELDTRQWDPVAVKQQVEKAAKRRSSNVRIKEPCITVEYAEQGQPKYHVDIAVYGKNHLTGDRELARGKTHSGPAYRSWEPASPQHLGQVLTSAFTDALAQAQFIRLIRYLKRWKDRHFTKVGNNTPPGIALTAMAYRWCQPRVRDPHGDAQVDDLAALIQLIEAIRRHHYGLNVTLTVPPGNHILQKMGNSPNHRKQYRQKLDQLCQSLTQAEQARRADNKAAALRALQQALGPDF